MSSIAVEMGKGGVCIMPSVFVVGISYSVFRLYMSCRNAPGWSMHYAFCIRGRHFVVCIQRDAYYVLNTALLNVLKKGCWGGGGGGCFWYKMK
jgi:hypothetical protein